MDMSIERRTATVYEFPLRGRFAQVERQRQAAAEAERLPRTACGSGWYHEAAMDAERLRKS